MTIPELKNEFHKVRDNRRQVSALREKAEALRQSAMGGAIRYDKDHVQTTPMNYQEQALVEAADMETLANRLIEEGDVLRLTLLGYINRLEDIEEQTILIRHYFNNVSLRDIECNSDNGMDHVTIWRRKEDALEKIIKSLHFETNETSETK